MESDGYAVCYPNQPNLKGMDVFLKISDGQAVATVLRCCTIFSDLLEAKTMAKFFPNMGSGHCDAVVMRVVYPKIALHVEPL